jgi:hypothetical protein
MRFQVHRKASSQPAIAKTKQRSSGTAPWSAETEFCIKMDLFNACQAAWIDR